MKTLIIIPCFVNTERKLNLLKESIACFKKLNHDILVTSHCSLPPDVIQSINYYIFDSDNTFNEINFYKNYWWKNAKCQIEINHYPEDKLKDHAFPVLKLIRCSFALASYLEYDYVIVSDFDNYYDDEDLEKIKNIYNIVVENKKKFFAFYVEEPYPSWDIMFFITQPNFLLQLTDFYFPKSIEKYNELFTYQYPYGLENFYGNLIKPFKNEGYLLKDNFHTYFNTKNLGKSNLTDFKVYIVNNNENKYYLVIILNNKSQYKINVKRNDILLNTFISHDSFDVIYEFIESCEITVEVFDHENNFIKNETIHFNINDKNKYSRNKITFFE